jgi:hypothetical protein
LKWLPASDQLASDSAYQRHPSLVHWSTSST